jgi:2-polyprenyl-3-methyl-5-hydroxy-6-metoxy-1,4-benzoquinol methylase
MNNILKIINCPLCDKVKNKKVYQYKCNAGEVLGRLHVTISQCEACGFIYSNPRPSYELIAKHYLHESSGAVYHENESGDRHTLIMDQQANFVKVNVCHSKKQKLIDIGCGQGDFLKQLDSEEFDRYGLDPIVEGSLRTEHKINIIDSYIEDYNITDKKFDVITCFNSLEHYYYPSTVLKKLSCLIKDDGDLFIEVPNSLEPVPQTSNFFSFEHLSHFTAFTCR